MTYAMYYGPALIIDDIGFDIFVSSYLVNLSELVTFVPSFFLIEKIPRKLMGIILFVAAAFCALLLTFIVKPEECDLCIQSILEIIFIFIFRGCVSFFFCFFQVYFCELYPARARGMGSGIVSAVGTLASTSSPIYLGYLRRNGINVMSFFVLFAIIAIGNLFLLHETKGAPLKEEIE
jgi:sugar phosphate permease